MSDKKIGVIGCGVMGQAILSGFLASSLIDNSNIRITTIPEMLSDLKVDFPQIEANSDNMATIEWADVVIFSLKPHILLNFLSDHKVQNVLNIAGKLVISIAGGVSLSQLGQFIKAPAELIRVMPNIAAMVQESMNIITAADGCSSESLELCRSLFETTGRCQILPESQLDVATALCGCSPAFFCTIIEALGSGAVKMGLNPKLAYELAAQTMAGTGQMMLSTGEHPAVLRDKVTTPGGITIDGLAVMEEGNIRSVLSKTIEHCTEKSRNMCNK